MKQVTPVLLEVWITLYLANYDRFSFQHAKAKLIKYYGSVDKAFDVYEEGYYVN